MSFFHRATLVAAAVGCAALMCSSSIESRLVSASCPPIVVMAEVVHGHIAYSVNSKPAYPDLLRVLGVAEERYGDSCPVIALIDLRAPIDETGNIEGVAAKAGFSKVQFYVFSKVSRKMSTLQFGPVLPFSMNPPVE